jgi:four helix bundle protein
MPSVVAGHVSANPVARNHKELFAWQRCAELRRLILRYTRVGCVRQDHRFLGQIRGSVRSACNLTSEGFYRKRDGDFINYLVMARGSLGEASDQIADGVDSEYFTTGQGNEMIVVLKRAMRANRRLREYLERCQAERKRRTQGPKGPKDPRTQGPKDPRTQGPKDLRTQGPKDPRTQGSSHTSTP